jgi:hypothetical protein
MGYEGPPDGNSSTAYWSLSKVEISPFTRLTFGACQAAAPHGLDVPLHDVPGRHGASIDYPQDRRQARRRPASRATFGAVPGSHDRLKSTAVWQEPFFKFLIFCMLVAREASRT